MNFKEIQELIKQIDKSNLAEFKLKNQEIEIQIRTQKYFKKDPISNGAPTVVAAPQVQATPVSAPIAPTPTLPSSQELEAQKTVSPAAPASKLIEVKSPMVGTFYRAGGPGKPAFVSVGDTIENGTVVCIIEAMKLFNEIESEVSGKVVKVMVEDASPVEYDQVLFLIEP
jgi:acetyl-CoA carboxylase biotin carboxyl carrier protein